MFIFLNAEQHKFQKKFRVLGVQQIIFGGNKIISVVIYYKYPFSERFSVNINHYLLLQLISILNIFL